MNFDNMFLIFKNTLQKEARSKTILFLTIITLGMLVLTNAVLKFFSEQILNQVDPSMLGNQAMAIFLWAIGIWVYLLSVYLGVSTVRSDLDDHVAAQLLSFPIKRHEYLLARMLGVSFLVVGFYILCLVGAVVSLSVTSGAAVGDWGVIVGVITNLFSVTACVGIAMLVSLYMNKLMSFVVTIFITMFIFLANSFYATNEILKFYEGFSIKKLFYAFFHVFLPHLGRISDMVTAYLLGKDLPFPLLNEIGHFIFSFLFVFVVMSFLFRKKEI